MDLFDNKIDEPINLISQDGIVDYYGALQSSEDADDYFVKLLDKIEWKNDEVIIYGKKIVTKRKVAWYGDKPFEFTYSNTTKRALPWIKELLALKALVEERSDETFNSCLLNLYHNGQEGMSWHCDEERDLKKNGAIGSLSFGAERKFSLKHKKSKETVSLILQHGSLLVMKGATQTNWLHSLPPTTKIAEPRINLTFRTIV
jgi:alkylated DNA repair dioxygenase AlkB